MRQFYEQEKIVKTMTIRGVDELTMIAIKERARKEVTSVNTAVLKIIREEVGLRKSPGLEHTQVLTI